VVGIEQAVVQSMRLDNSTLEMAFGEEGAGEQVVGEVAPETRARGLGRDFQESILVRWGNLEQGKMVRELGFGSGRKIGVRKGHIAHRIYQDLVQQVVGQDVNSLKMKNDT
jgi:hypothetical protein